MLRSATTLGLSCTTFLIGLFLGCADKEGTLGEACVDGMYCFDNLVCVDGVCSFGDASTSVGDGDTTGDGDPAGDGDPSGDGDPGDGDPGDGDPGDGDPGDGDPSAGHELYEGPCLTSEDCAAGLFCAYANGRYWCTSECADANDTSCPSYPGASATPECTSVQDNDVGGGAKWGCTLVCADESECPAGAQCFGSGIGSELWCGFLPE